MKRQYSDAKNQLDLNLKDECTTCHGTGAKPGTSPETCPKCGGKGQIVYTQQSLFGTVRNVQTCPDCNGSGKIVKREMCGLPWKRLHHKPQEDRSDDPGRY